MLAGDLSRYPMGRAMTSPTLIDPVRTAAFKTQRIVADAYGLTAEAIANTTNTKAEYSRARHALRYALNLQGFSKKRIAAALGIDRHNVSHSCNKARDLIITDPDFRDAWRKVAKALNLNTWV